MKKYFIALALFLTLPLFAWGITVPWERPSVGLQHPIFSSDAIVIGDTATSSDGIFEVNGNSTFEGAVDIIGAITATDWTDVSITESQISDLDHFTGADITGSETAFDGWDKNASDDYDSSDFNTDFSGKSTTDLLEGTNLYFTDERAEDAAGGMFSGNTETLITATYQDADGTVDLVVDNNLANYDNTTSGFFDASSDVDHDSTTGFVSNEHIDHSTVSVSAGTGLSGGGDITTSRTLNLDINSLTDRSAFTSGDKLAIYEAGVGIRKVDYDDLPGAGGGITSLNSQTGSTQTFATSTSADTFTIDSSSNTHTFTIPSNLGFFTNDSGYITDYTVTEADVTQHEGAIDHDALTNFAAGEHFTQSAITTVGTISTGVWEGTDVGVVHGGTGASTAAGALTNLGLTATAAELNILDGAIINTTELNYLDGVVSVNKVKVNRKYIEINDGATTSISASVYDLSGTTTAGTIEWSSDDATIASVNSSTGEITAQQVGGPVTITATETGSGITDTAIVEVVAAEVAQVSLSPSSTSISVGQSTFLSASVLDGNGDSITRSVTWDSEDDKIASVSLSGEVTGHSPGTVYITGSAGKTLVGFSEVTVTGYAAEERIISTTIASTSPEFVSGGSLPAIMDKDGFELTEYTCFVEGGTSVVVSIEDSSSNSTETITCTTSGAKDTNVSTNNTFTADERGYISIGTITGSVNYLHFQAYGNVTR